MSYDTAKTSCPEQQPTSNTTTNQGPVNRGFQTVVRDCQLGRGYNGLPGREGGKKEIKQR